MADKLKKYSFWLILSVIIIGAIIPFSAQFLLPTIFPKIHPYGAEIWNQYVSIILGVVATILSIVSLVLCFRSEDRTRDSNNKLNDSIKTMNDKIIEIDNKQKILNDNFTMFLGQEVNFQDSKNKKNIKKPIETENDEFKSI